MNDIGTNLRRLRKERKLTQEQLSNEASISHTTLWNVETGKTTPRVAIAEKLANVLGVSAEEILFPKPETPPSSVGRTDGLVWGSDALVKPSEGVVKVGRAELSAALYAIETGLISADAAADKLLS